MKRLLKVVACLLVIFLLTGCVSEKRREDIIDYLKKEKIVDKKWELVYEITSKHQDSLEGGLKVRSTNFYDYVFKSGDDYYIIRIDDDSKKYNSEERSDTYTVIKYKTNKVDEFIEHNDELGNYYVYTKDGKNTSYKNHIYQNNMVEEKKYEVKFTKKNFLMFVWYKKEVKEIN